MGGLPTELSAILKNHPPGRWIAISRDKVIADAETAHDVMQLAAREGEPNPIVIRIPTTDPPPTPNSVGLRKPPYGAIVKEWKRGQVVPFLGAGASLIRQPKDAVWDVKSPFLPNAAELSSYLATLADFPGKLQQDQDLAKISSFYTMTIGREGLLNAVREALGPICPDGPPRCPPGNIHSYIAGLEQPKLIITTNYDTLLEQAFRKASRDYDLLVYPADRNDNRNAAMWREHGSKRNLYLLPDDLPIDFEASTRPIIYKMHGSLDEEPGQDTFVISEEDYLNFLSRMGDATAVPSVVLSYLRTRSLLFLGYSLRDWNLRMVLRNLKGVVTTGVKNAPLRRYDQDKVIPSWAIQRRPSEVEKELWDARGVRLYDEDVEEFALKMSPLS